MIYDVSDPTNMCRVCEKWYWAPYGQSPNTIGAWELDGKRYVYMTGVGFSWSLDVTDPHNPVVLNFGDRGYITYGSVTHGLRFYGMGVSPYDFAVYFLEDPVYIPVVGWHEKDSIYGPRGGLWTNGYVVGYAGQQLAIYRYAEDTIPQDTATKYFEWVQTAYDRPELRFSLIWKAQVSFSLFNAVGQKAFGKDLGILGPGPHTVALPGLGVGVYFLFLKANGATIRKKVVFGR